MTAAKNIAAIILAAGQSKRFGDQNKMLFEVDGTAIIRRTVSTVSSAQLGDAVLVSGKDTADVLKACEGVDIRHIENPTPWAGMGTSLAAGANAISEDMEAFFVVLGDMPFLKSETITQMAEAFDPKSGNDIAVPIHNGRRGHPVLFAKKYLTRLRALTGDQGARALLIEHPERIQAIVVDDAGTLVDIDKLEDATTKDQ